MTAKIIDLKERKDEDKPYVRFYRDFVECDFCGQLTRGRVYEDSQEITCGSCNATLWEFESDIAIAFEPDCEIFSMENMDVEED
jgi:ribosomal protein S27E